MMSALGALYLLSLFSATVPISADLQEHPEPSRSVSIESNANLANIGDHVQNAGRSHRIDLSSVGAGTTLMEDVRLGESSLVRREGVVSSAAAEIEQEVVERHEARRAKAVSWAACDQGECKCHSRRRVIIRYQRERAKGRYSGSLEQEVNLLTNWHFRWHARPYTSTPQEEFNKGFTSNATNLQQCGGDHAWAKDCLRKPEECAFDTSDTNPYDAKAGQYCCSHQYEYCSYKCEGEETFKCPTLTTDINFPGGMDPAGPTVFKRCYMAQYPHGMNPESATDADLDVGGNGD